MNKQLLVPGLAIVNESYSSQILIPGAGIIDLFVTNAPGYGTIKTMQVSSMRIGL